MTSKDQHDRTDIRARVHDQGQQRTLDLAAGWEKARAREQDERRQEGLADARATMAAIFEGPPEFVDLTVIDDFLP
jgi:hypothetical protein